MRAADVFELLKAVNSPAVLVSLLAPTVALLLAASWSGDVVARLHPRRLAIVRAVGALGVVVYVVYGLHYLGMGRCFDHLEATVVATTRLLDLGRPLYHDRDAPSRYAMLYGPNTYLVPWLLARLGGGSTSALKLVSAVFALGAFSLTAVTLRTTARSPLALWSGIAYFGAAALIFREKLIWLRGDPQLFFWCALGLWGATRRRAIAGFALVGLALGAAVGTKAHAFLYFVPILALVARPRGRAEWGAFLACALLAIMAPFVLTGVPLADYLGWLGLAARHGLSPTLALQVVVTGGFILLPVAIAVAGRLAAMTPEARSEFTSARRGAVLAVAFAAAALLIPAAKLGGGEWHLLPLVPIAAWVLARATSHEGAPPDPSARMPWGRGGIILGSYLVLATLQCLTLPLQVAHGLVSRAPEQRAIAAEARRLAAKYAEGSLEMGYAGDSTYVRTFARTELPPVPGLVLDAGALMDMEESDLGIPRASLNALSHGAVKRWLIPRGEAPFTLHNYYRQEELFDWDLRKVFLDRYHRIERGRYFDVWEYSAPGE